MYDRFNNIHIWSFFQPTQQDLFPGVDYPRVGYPEFTEEVEKVLEDDGYIIMQKQVCSVCRRKRSLEFGDLIWFKVPK